jgi:ribosomal protein S18 acetylase RimI-like enzyme
MRTLVARIRPARPADDVPLANALDTAVEAIERRRRGSKPGHAMFVAEVEEQACGSVSVNVVNDVPALLHLYALGVAPHLQRRGIGTALIERVEAEAKARGQRGVWLDVGVTNVEARRLYERLGYFVEGEVVINRYIRYPEAEPAEEACHRMFKRFEESA